MEMLSAQGTCEGLENVYHYWKQKNQDVLHKA